MGMFNKVFKINRKPTLGEQIEVAKGQASEALGMFEEAHKKLENANGILSETADEAARQIEELQRHLVRTNDEIQMNQAVQNRLKDFIPSVQA